MIANITNGMIIEYGIMYNIFRQLLDGRADFLANILILGLSKFFLSSIYCTN